MLSERLDRIILRSRFAFTLFFFMHAQQFLVDNTLFMHCLCTINHCLCTVHGTHNHFIQKKNILEMGPMSLFTHLKIILLQCFRFSVK